MPIANNTNTKYYTNTILTLEFNNNNNNTDFKCLFLGKFKDTEKKFTMKIN